MARKTDGPLIAVVGNRSDDLAIEERVFAPLRPRLVRGMGTRASELAALCQKAEGVIVYAVPKFTARVIERLESCRILARAGIGVDNIDLGAAKKRKIVVTNIPDYCVDEVSDHAMSLILQFARKLETGIAEVREGGWGIARLVPVRPLRSAVIGIVGIGRIGTALGKKARAFGMQILAYDPFAPEAAFRRLKAEKVSPTRLYRDSDYISLHVPLISKTRGMVGADTLRRMKKEAVLINVARGELIDEVALRKALRTGMIRGAGLDVLSEEPPSRKHPLVGIPNCVITPHSAWYSTTAQEELRRKSAEEVFRVLSGGRPKYRIV